MLLRPLHSRPVFVSPNGFSLLYVSQDKRDSIFHFSPQKLCCGYSLEVPDQTIFFVENYEKYQYMYFLVEKASYLELCFGAVSEHGLHCHYTSINFLVCEQNVKEICSNLGHVW